MKHAFLSGMILLMLLATCCVHLPLKEEEKPTPAMTQDVQKLLDEVSYGDRTFVRQIFDCSNETAFLHAYFTMKGYKCGIVFGVPYYIWKLKGWVEDFHVWLTLEKDGKKFLIESTTREVVDEYYHSDLGFIIQIPMSLETADKYSKFFSIFGICTEDEFKY